MISNVYSVPSRPNSSLRGAEGSVNTIDSSTRLKSTCGLARNGTLRMDSTYDYHRLQKQHHKKIVDACVLALKKGKAVVYPTDTSYGLAVDAGNIKAVKKLYQIKGRKFNKPVHVVVPSMSYAKRITVWNKATEKLSRGFWPGALTLVVPVGAGLGRPSQISGAQARPLQKSLLLLSANTGTIGLQCPKVILPRTWPKFLVGRLPPPAQIYPETPIVIPPMK